MSNELVQFDPKKMADAIHGKIRAEMLGLIPDETWKTMIEAEIKRFTQPYEEKNGWGERKIVASPLQQVIEAVLREHVTAQLKSALEQPEWRVGFDYQDGQQRVVLGDAVKKLAGDVGPQVLNSLFEQIAAGVVQKFADAVRQGRA